MFIVLTGIGPESLTNIELRGSSSSRLRFSNRKLDRNVSTSEIEVRAQGDSNSSEGESEVKERRLDSAPRGDAPKGIRTPVLGLKGLRPSPLDDGGVLSRRILSFGG